MRFTQAIPTLQFFSPVSPTDTTRTHVGHKRRCYSNPSLPRCAHQVFDQIPPTDTFAWNALIRTHLAEGDPGMAISVYHQMMARGVRPDKHTLPRVLSAASIACDLLSGKQLHGHALKHGFASDEYVVTALMSMYGRFLGADAACEVHKVNSKCNTISWTQLMKLYLEEGRPDSALSVFKRMEASRVPVDAIAVATALKACGMLHSIYEGRRVHLVARANGLEFDPRVGTSIMKMYLECGKVEECRVFFENLPLKDGISWTTMIGGYVQNGEFHEGLKLFRNMCLSGLKPDSFAVTAILPACARMSARKYGKEINGYLIRQEVDMNVAVQNALMDMYVKSGCLKSASSIFYHMTEKDAISWTIMILGYSLHRQGDLGVKLLLAMQKQPGFLPDQTVYAAGLYACYAARSVEEGKGWFNCIRNPEIEHYILMVGLLARVGLCAEAVSFARDNGIRMNVGVQRALLDGCRIHKNTKLGKRIAEQLIGSEPLNPENYTLLCNFYASKGRWDEVKAWRQAITDMGLRTKKACSWIEVMGKVHLFIVGDVSHPRSERIYWELEQLKKKMEEEGYVPDNDFSLHEVDEERECVLSGHSEMLAMAFGLVRVPGKSAIRVTKNLRVCQSCHSSAKVISKFVGREIIIKDPYCFHHFKDGLCSCEDFW